MNAAHRSGEPLRRSPSKIFSLPWVAHFAALLLLLLNIPLPLRAQEAQSKESQSQESQSQESQSQESQPQESQPEEAQPKDAESNKAEPKEPEPAAEATPAETEPDEAAGNDAKPKDAKPKDAKPKEAQPKEAQPKEAQPKDSERNADALESVGEAIREAIERLWVPNSRLATGPHVREAFRDVIQDVNKATVIIRKQDKQVALGGIVGPDGWILTKGTEVRGGVKVKLADGREFDAKLVGLDRQYDLAMLKIDASGLPVLQLNEKVPIEIGQWVATPSGEPDPTAAGIVSVKARTIDHQWGILGVRLDEGARVEQVYANSGASRAGIQANDVITAIDGVPTPDRETLQRNIRGKNPGDEVKIELERGGEKMTVIAILVGEVHDFGISQSQFQNNMGGALSARRFGFPRAIQHDSILRPEDCGGPLVDLEGRVIGFNIARSGRTESYAVPSDAVIARLYDLMSGKLTPKGE